MQSVVADRRNQKCIQKLHNYLQEFQHKLDLRVDDMISSMIGTSKLASDAVNDSINLPDIVSRKATATSASGTATTTTIHGNHGNPIYSSAIKLCQTAKKHKQDQRRKNDNLRNKSLSSNLPLQFDNNELLDTLTSSIKTKPKQVDYNRRPVGAYKATRPKFIRRIPQIMNKQARLNPFYQRNAIKSYELDMGVLRLIQRGRIGKDVNVITAFEKGSPVLQLGRAILHDNQEKLVEMIAPVTRQERQSRVLTTQMMQSKLLRQRQRQRQRQQQPNWAITMLQQQLSQRHNKVHKLQQIVLNQPIIDLTQSLYIKIVKYQVVQDDNYCTMRKQFIQQFPAMRQLLMQIVKFVRKNGVGLVYVDSKKVGSMVTSLRKLHDKELEECVVRPKGGKLFGFRQMISEEMREAKALQVVTGILRCHVARLRFKAWKKRLQISKTICRWARNTILIKAVRRGIKAMRETTDAKFLAMQQAFRKQYSQLQRQKHYQIHIANQHLKQPQSSFQTLNTQLPRMFNLNNPNTHIIYVLPTSLSAQTVHYYYKIMELQEIHNYKQRVTFLEVDTQGVFVNTMPLSTKLYYHSAALRRLKKKINQQQAYLCLSYPTAVDIKLAVYLNIPILSGNLVELLQYQLRSESQRLFKMPRLQSFVIKPRMGKLEMTGLADEIRVYCEANPRCNKVLVKVNHCYQSTGLALLTYPFNSLPDMYDNTRLISGNTTVQGYYKMLGRYGGVIQQYVQSLSAICVAVEISSEFEVEVVGTFEKVSIGFVNIAYTFPQKRVQHGKLMLAVQRVVDKLKQLQHFGCAQLSFLVDLRGTIYLQKVQCYFTNIGSSLFYFRFLTQGQLSSTGEYLAKIVQSYGDEATREEDIVSSEGRSFCYVPYLRHFGLSDKQTASFFELCRLGGVSFDLQNKYGATFILLGSLKSSLGIITTARQQKTALKLLSKSLQFIIRQNSHNSEIKNREKCLQVKQNILNVKNRIEQL